MSPRQLDSRRCQLILIAAICFFTSHQSAEALRQKVEDFIQSEFALTIKVFLRNRQQIQEIAAGLPDSWRNNEKMRSDIIFLGDHCDNPSILKKITIQLEVDEVRYVSGALLWRADRLSLNRSGLMKLAATEVYASMTIRNCNTFRKIAELMS